MWERRIKEYMIRPSGEERKKDKIAKKMLNEWWAREKDRAKYLFFALPGWRGEREGRKKRNLFEKGEWRERDEREIPHLSPVGLPLGANILLFSFHPFTPSPSAALRERKDKIPLGAMRFLYLCARLGKGRPAYFAFILSLIPRPSFFIHSPFGPKRNEEKRIWARGIR